LSCSLHAANCTRVGAIRGFSRRQTADCQCFHIKRSLNIVLHVSLKKKLVNSLVPVNQRLLPTITNDLGVAEALADYQKQKQSLVISGMYAWPEQNGVR
jgi:hypothetical protein